MSSQLKIATERNGTLEKQNADTKKSMGASKQRYEEELQDLVEKKVKLQSQVDT